MSSVFMDFHKESKEKLFNPGTTTLIGDDLIGLEVVFFFVNAKTVFIICASLQ